MSEYYNAEDGSVSDSSLNLRSNETKKEQILTHNIIAILMSMSKGHYYSVESQEDQTVKSSIETIQNIDYKDSTERRIGVIAIKEPKKQVCVSKSDCGPGEACRVISEQND